MVSVRRHFRWKSSLGPVMDPHLHQHPVEEGEAGGGDEPVRFLRDIDFNQPPTIPRGRGRGRPRGRGGGGRLRGGWNLHGRYQRPWQVPRGLLLGRDVAPAAKSVILALAVPNPNGSHKIAALATCSSSKKIKRKAFCHRDKKGSQDYVYLRESIRHEIVPFEFEIPVEVICEEVPLLDLGCGNTPNGIEEESQKGQSNLENTWVWKTTAHREMLEKISSGIKSCVEASKKGLRDVSVVPSFDLPPDKYDGAQGVILRATDIVDSSEREFFTYVQYDLAILQGLANAETVDKIALSSQINKILAHWTKLFSSHISRGMAEMMQALNDLKGLIASDVVSPLPFDAVGATAHKTHIEETLKEAAAVQEAIPGALQEIDQIEVVARANCNDLAALKVKQKEKIVRLKALLALEENSLKETENQETEIEQLMKECEAVRQDFSKYSDDLEKTIGSGELAKNEVQKFMQYIGVGSKSSQPKPVRSLISYIQSSSCEG